MARLLDGPWTHQFMGILEALGIICLNIWLRQMCRPTRVFPVQEGENPPSAFDVMPHCLNQVSF
eukprot:1156476-Pelagomonas_calceolata.AAC.3